MTSSMSLPSGSQLCVLMENLSQEEELSGYDSADEWKETLQALTENDTSCEVECQGVSRSLLDSEDSFVALLNRVCKSASLNKSFDVGNADVVFRAVDNLSSDSDYFSYEYWVANPSKNWLVVVSGGMGSYCDENYDASVRLSFDINCDQAALKEKISSRVTEWSQELSCSMQKSIDNLLSTVPEDQRAELQNVIVSQFKKTEFFAPVLASKENQEITSHVDQVDGVDTKTSSKTLKI